MAVQLRRHWADNIVFLLLLSLIANTYFIVPERVGDRVDAVG